MVGLGKILILFGIIIVVVGLVLVYAGNSLSWFGQLPGDIRVKRENFSLYFPLTSMLILSLIISAVIWLVRRFL